LLAQAARDLHSVFAGQAKVEDHNVDRFLRHQLCDAASARKRGYAHLVVAEVVANQLEHRRVVVDGENVG
jgi:hypothetical protein